MLSAVMYADIIERALAEDLGSGDITTEATVESDTKARAIAVARGPLVVCGGEVFAAVFHRLDPNVHYAQLVADGAKEMSGAALWGLEGKARSILAGERVALNLVQRMSGIATLTRAYVEQIPKDSSARVTDTRKTIPGLRVLERYAVRVGGGHNHRDTLSSAVLIKDNHIVAAGGIENALRRVRERAPHTTRIEIEVANLRELDRALSMGCDVVLLDNFDQEDLAEALRRAKGKVVIEVSGGIQIERVAELARAGVDIISVGALTHSAPAANIALDMELLP